MEHDPVTTGTTAADKGATDMDSVACTAPALFVVDSEYAANWVVKKIVQARQYARRVKHWAEQERYRSKTEEERLLFLFGAQLKAWTTAELSRGRRRSINLPGGRVGYRRESAKLIVLDDEAVLEWARMHCPKAIRVVEHLLKFAIDEHFATTGELPPVGVRLEAPTERFFIS